MKTFNNLLLNDVNKQSPQNMTLKGIAAKPANPKRSKTSPQFVDVTLLKKDHIIFYKRLSTEIAYALISFSNFKKYNLTNYNRFFFSIYKILNKYAKKSSSLKSNKHITKLALLNLASYNEFVLSICSDFNTLFFALPSNILDNSKKDDIKSTKKFHKEALKLFHLSIFNSYVKLISKKN